MLPLTRQTRFLLFFVATCCWCWFTPVMPRPLGPLLLLGGLVAVFLYDDRLISWIVDGRPNGKDTDATTDEDDDFGPGRSA